MPQIFVEQMNFIILYVSPCIFYFLLFFLLNYIVTKDGSSFIKYYFEIKKKGRYEYSDHMLLSDYSYPWSMKIPIHLPFFFIHFLIYAHSSPKESTNTSIFPPSFLFIYESPSEIILCCLGLSITLIALLFAFNRKDLVFNSKTIIREFNLDKILKKCIFYVFAIAILSIIYSAEKNFPYIINFPHVDLPLIFELFIFTILVFISYFTLISPIALLFNTIRLTTSITMIVCETEKFESKMLDALHHYLYCDDKNLATTISINLDNYNKINKHYVKTYTKYAKKFYKKLYEKNKRSNKITINFICFIDRTSPFKLSWFTYSCRTFPFIILLLSMIFSLSIFSLTHSNKTLLSDNNLSLNQLSFLPLLFIIHLILMQLGKSIVFIKNKYLYPTVQYTMGNWGYLFFNNNKYLHYFSPSSLLCDYSKDVKWLRTLYNIIILFKMILNIKIADKASKDLLAQLQDLINPQNDEKKQTNDSATWINVLPYYLCCFLYYQKLDCSDEKTVLLSDINSCFKKYDYELDGTLKSCSEAFILDINRDNMDINQSDSVKELREFTKSLEEIIFPSNECSIDEDIETDIFHNNQENILSY